MGGLGRVAHGARYHTISPLVRSSQDQLAQVTEAIRQVVAGVRDPATGDDLGAPYRGRGAK